MIDLESLAAVQFDGEQTERRALRQTRQNPFKILRRHAQLPPSSGAPSGNRKSRSAPPSITGEFTCQFPSEQGNHRTSNRCLAMASCDLPGFSFS